MLKTQDFFDEVEQARNILGSGAFCSAYLYNGIVYTIETSDGDISKTLLCNLSGKACHLPRIQYLGTSRGRKVYRMPFYRNARTAEEKRLSFALQAVGHTANDETVYCGMPMVDILDKVAKRADIPGTLKESLLTLTQEIRRFTAVNSWHVMADLEPRNIGFDLWDNLILRDPIVIYKTDIIEVK